MNGEGRGRHLLERRPHALVGVRAERVEVLPQRSREEEWRLHDEREPRAQLVQAKASADHPVNGHVPR